MESWATLGSLVLVVAIGVYLMIDLLAHVRSGRRWFEEETRRRQQRWREQLDKERRGK